MFLRAVPFFRQIATPSRIFLFSVVLATAPRFGALPLRPEPQLHDPGRSARRPVHALRSRSRMYRDGRSAGVGGARPLSRKRPLSGRAELRLPRWSGTWKWPWAGRRGRSEYWESPTGAELTQELLSEGPRQVCSPVTSCPLRRPCSLEVEHEPDLGPQPRSLLGPDLWWRRVPGLRVGPGGTTPGVTAASGIAPVHIRQRIHCWAKAPRGLRQGVLPRPETGLRLADLQTLVHKEVRSPRAREGNKPQDYFG